MARSEVGSSINNLFFFCSCRSGNYKVPDETLERNAPQSLDGGSVREQSHACLFACCFFFCFFYKQSRFFSYYSFGRRRPRSVFLHTQRAADTWQGCAAAPWRPAHFPACKCHFARKNTRSPFVWFSDATSNKVPRCLCRHTPLMWSGYYNNKIS